MQHQVDAPLHQLAGALLTRVDGEGRADGWVRGEGQQRRRACEEGRAPAGPGTLCSGSVISARPSAQRTSRKPPCPSPPAALSAGLGRGRARRGGSQSEPPWRTPLPPGARRAGGRAVTRQGEREGLSGHGTCTATQCIPSCIVAHRKPGVHHCPAHRTWTAICWSGWPTRSSKRPRKCAFSSSESDLHPPEGQRAVRVWLLKSEAWQPSERAGCERQPACRQA